MITVVSTMQLESNSENEWDQLLRERFKSAHDKAGWISGQLLASAGAPSTRVIIGTWRSRSDWEAWHEDPAFLASRTRLGELQSVDHQTVLYDVIEDAQGTN
ncbi:antibiotic biosynthesis monooxygenase family protein [Pseudarthrobacter oxydans]|uniref:antibiotic biosynthesis monooxygenase family protein n=1 Tax=Pseudarthrobacter oxydans TaxID=1671 RepID=UPI003436D4FD